MPKAAAHRSRPRIGLLWPQFAPYHVDRCEAVARRLAERAEVVAVEVCSASSLYAWDPSGHVDGATKLTLFPGRGYESVRLLRRFWRQLMVLRRCDVVFIGVSYAEPDIIALSFCLRAFGVRTIMMTESKFDDVPRNVAKEAFKAVLLRAYAASIVGGARQETFVRFLGFGHRRSVLPGYDAVGLARVRAQGGGITAPDGRPFKERPFVFVGRFVSKKNVPFLIDAFACYTKLARLPPRRLLLVGGGELERSVCDRIAAHGLEDLVEVTGFLQADGVSAALAGGLALILPSSEEQWGLVVNEAMAFNLPVIVSEAVGARDTLVRSLVNGFVIETGSTEGFARAMLTLAENEDEWRRMVAASAQRAPLGDVIMFADAVDLTLGHVLQGWVSAD